MDAPENLASSLESLKPSKGTAMVREAITKISAAQARGVTNAEIYEAMKKEGLALSYRSFLNAITKAKKAKSETAPAVKNEPAPQAINTQQENEEFPSFAKPSSKESIADQFIKKPKFGGNE